MSAEFEKLMLEKMDKLSGDLNSFRDNITERLVNFEKFTIKKFEEHDKKFETIDKKFDVIDKKFDAIDKKFVSIDKQFDVIGKQINKLTEDMQVVKEAVILMEDRITREIPTLFDAYSMHQNKQERQENEIDSLNLKVEDHDIRISCLEQKVI